MKKGFLSLTVSDCRHIINGSILESSSSDINFDTVHDSFLYLTWISFQTFRWKEKRNMKVSLIINWWNDPSESYQLFLQLFHFRNISFHQIVRGENAVQERIQIIISDFYFLVIRFSHNLYFISSSSLRTFQRKYSCFNVCLFDICLHI